MQTVVEVQTLGGHEIFGGPRYCEAAASDEVEDMCSRYGSVRPSSCTATGSAVGWFVSIPAPGSTGIRCVHSGHLPMSRHNRP